MTRILIEDLPFYQYVGNDNSSGLRAFYLEGDQICLIESSNGGSNASGALVVSYYIRPNQLVAEEDVCFVTEANLKKGTIKVSNIPDVFNSGVLFDFTSIRAPYMLSAKDRVPTNNATITSLVYTFGTQQILTVALLPKASTPVGSFVAVRDETEVPTVNTAFWLDVSGTDPVPQLGAAYVYVRVDISGATTADDVAVLVTASMQANLSTNLVATAATGIVTVKNAGQGVCVGPNFSLGGSLLVTRVQSGTNTIVDTNIGVGDVMALTEQTIIPQIPVELQPMLAQRVAMRCLEALGDTEGLQMAAAKLQEMEIKTGAIISSRVEGAPLKVANRHSFLNSFRRFSRR
jgi:hypothetical protein